MLVLCLQNALAKASYNDHHLPSGAKVEWISDVK